MWAWITSHKKIVLGSAILLVVVLAYALGGMVAERAKNVFNSLQRVGQAVEENRKLKERVEKLDVWWANRYQDLHDELEEMKAEREKPWLPPADAQELVKRFEKAGFPGGKVRP